MRLVSPVRLGAQRTKHQDNSTIHLCNNSPLAEQASQSAAGDLTACKSTRAVLAHSATGLSERSPKDPAGPMGHNHARTHTGDPNT